MKRLGAVLMYLGLAVGAAGGIWLAVGLEKVQLPWLVSVGLIKLIVVVSFALMGVGAVLTRRARKREQVPSHREPT